jgi:hypothetical protein
MERQMSALTELNTEIAKLPPEVQIRINVIVEAIRGMLSCDVIHETELAMQLVIVEIEEDELACDLIEVDLKRQEH